MAAFNKYRFPFASYPAVRLALLLSTGITLDYHFNIGCSTWAIAFGLSALCYSLSELHYQKSLNSRPYNFAIISYLLITLCFGGIWHSFFDYRDVPPKATVINTFTWQELAFKGIIQQLQETSTGKYQVDVAVDTTQFPGKHPWSEPFRIRAVLNPDDLPMPKEIKAGDRITFTATVYPLEEKRNPSQFDYKQYLASKGIYSQVGIKSINTISYSEKRLSWAKFRSDVLGAIENNFSEDNAALAKALLIGYKNELGRAEKITFSRAGLSHIMAVSGLHVGFILAPFWIMIPLFWAMRFGKQFGLLFLVSTLFIYAGLTGFSASVIRASLVGVFLTYGKLFHKVRDSKNLTAVAAILILLLNPSDLFSIGFQLSFGAVYVILLTAPVIQHELPAWIRFRRIGQPVMVVIISFIVQIGIFPLLAYYFGEFSLIGPLANAFVVPFLGLAVPPALLLLLVAIPFPAVAQMLNVPIDYFLSGLNWFVDTTANFPLSWVQVHLNDLLFFGIWIAGILVISSLRIPKMRWKMLTLLIGLLCIQQAQKVIQKYRPGTLHLTFFDVGQGDAALISSPNNKHFLIDTGRWQPDYNSAKYVIISYLKEHGIEKLDAVFLSHPHADHIGGILELINTIPIDTIYNSGSNYDSQLYFAYHQKATQEDIPIKSIGAGDQVPLDPSIRLFTYGPVQSANESNVNNRSVVIELVYGETEFLFMGDAESSQEERILNNYPALTDTDFLKVGHHGSKTSSKSGLLQAVTAHKGVVSLGKNNRFGHPHPQATRRLHQNIDQLFFTSLNGAIQFASNGKQIWKVD